MTVQELIDSLQNVVAHTPYDLSNVTIHTFDPNEMRWLPVTGFTYDANEVRLYADDN